MPILPIFVSILIIAIIGKLIYWAATYGRIKYLCPKCKHKMVLKRIETNQIPYCYKEGLTGYGTVSRLVFWCPVHKDFFTPVNK